MSIIKGIKLKRDRGVNFLSIENPEEKTFRLSRETSLPRKDVQPRRTFPGGRLYGSSIEISTIKYQGRRLCRVKIFRNQREELLGFFFLEVLICNA